MASTHWYDFVAHHRRRRANLLAPVPNGVVHGADVPVGHRGRLMSEQVPENVSANPGRGRVRHEGPPKVMQLDIGQSRTLRRSRKHGPRRLASHGRGSAIVQEPPPSDLRIDPRDGAQTLNCRGGKVMPPAPRLRTRKQQPSGPDMLPLDAEHFRDSKTRNRGESNRRDGRRISLLLRRERPEEIRQFGR